MPDGPVLYKVLPPGSWIPPGYDLGLVTPSGLDISSFIHVVKIPKLYSVNTGLQQTWRTWKKPLFFQKTWKMDIFTQKW